MPTRKNAGACERVVLDERQAFSAGIFVPRNADIQVVLEHVVFNARIGDIPCRAERRAAGIAADSLETAADNGAFS
jgi:hypothetical protein